MENYNMNQQNFNYFYPYNYYYNYQNQLYQSFPYQNYGLSNEFTPSTIDYSYLNNSVGTENNSSSFLTTSSVVTSSPSVNNSTDGSLPSSPKLSVSSSKSNETSSPDLKQDEENKVIREGKSKRRSRTQFSKQQVDCLEAIFQKSHYPEVNVVDRLSDKLGLSIERISVWFQNRRAKFKKTKKPSQSELNYERNNVESILGKPSNDNFNQYPLLSTNANTVTSNNRSWNSNADWAY